jgi:hypothetical protein
MQRGKDEESVSMLRAEMSAPGSGALVEYATSGVVKF